MNWPTFFKRLGSAIIFAAIMLTGLLYKDIVAIMILSLLIHFLCMKEWFQMSNRLFSTFGGREMSKFTQYIAQFLGLVVLASHWLEATFVWYFLLVALLCMLIYNVFYYKTQGWWSIFILTGLLYISFPISLLLLLQSVAFYLPLIAILLIWTNDTMAYIVGSFIGKTPFSKISPNKTWEGIVGGAVFTMLLAALASYFGWFFDKSWVYWVLLSLIVAFGSVIGDLFESKLKRIVNIKDSGQLMPGHGGALDRFDSMLVVLPLVFVYSYFLA